MTTYIADRTYQTSSTTGTGTLHLDSTVPTGFQSFVAGIGSGNACYYAIAQRNSSHWEVGIGTVTSGSPDTLSRSTVLASSNSNALVSFNGILDVFSTLPASVAMSSGGGTPGGSTTQVQFNSSGSFAGSSNFTYNNSTHALTTTDGTRTAVLTNGTAAGHFTAGTLTADLCPTAGAAHFAYTGGGFTADCCTASMALGCSDGTRTLAFSNGTYGLNASGGGREAFLLDSSNTSAATFVDSVHSTTVYICNGSTGIQTPSLQVTTSPTSGYVLTSDSSGNATWQAVAGSIAIGSPVGSGTAQCVLFIDGSTNVAQDASHFTFDYASGGLYVSDGNNSANLAPGSYAAQFVDNASPQHTVYLCGSAGAAVYATDANTHFAYLCNGSSAGYFGDGSHTVYIADGTNAVTVSSGYLFVPGISGSTMYFNNNATAPSNNSGSPPNTYYGSGTFNFLGEPNQWVLINISGTDYKIPCYS